MYIYNITYPYHGHHKLFGYGYDNHTLFFGTLELVLVWKIR